MKYEMGLTGEDRPSVGRVHSSISHRVRDFCHFPGDVLFLNTVLKVLILKLLLLSDPIRCPVAPGAHVKMKPVYFPRRGFGYFSILLFRDVSPSFQKAGGVFFSRAFPRACSEPFRTGVWGNRWVSCGAGGAWGRSRRSGRSCLQDPRISLPRCELLCEGEVDLWWAYCLREFYSAQGKPRGGGGLGRGCRDGVTQRGRAVVSCGMTGLEPSGKVFFVGRARTKGDGRRDAMTTFGGFPGNQGCHSNCITPVRISDFRWKACSPL